MDLYKKKQLAKNNKRRDHDHVKMTAHKTSFVRNELIIDSIFGQDKK
jgi:hypothetical protein